jgi:hypothetical protein
MGNIYSHKKLIPLKFFQRLFGKNPKENALIELNNLLASHSLSEIKAQDVQKISEKYKVDFQPDFVEDLKELYLKYLIHCLIDDILNDKEVEELNHLKSLLSLNDYNVELLHTQAASEVYKLHYDEAIFDEELNDSEREFLEKLKDKLRLPPDVIEKIRKESTEQILQNKFNEMVADGKISPNEWDDLEVIAKNLGSKLKFDDSTRAQIERFKYAWVIENGELPVKEVPISLQKGEQCYYFSEADWYEKRTITKRINYGGPTARIKIMKGVSYRMGSIGFQRVSSEELRLIDHGQVYVTNKRLIFLGNSKNTNIRLDKILSLNPYSDAVGIEKDSGRSPILKVNEGADILTLILSRVINDFK